MTCVSNDSSKSHSASVQRVVESVALRMVVWCFEQESLALAPSIFGPEKVRHDPIQA
jgi:hypothetical protein